MANPEHLAILKEGVERWNAWRVEHPEMYNKIALFGCAVAAAGLLVFIYFSYFTPVYAGASGAGMAGLGAGMAVLFGLVALALGAAVAAVSFLVGRIRRDSRTGE